MKNTCDILRPRRLHSARVELWDGRKLACLVREVSGGDAVLEFERPIVFPMELKLFINSDDDPRLCAHVWRGTSSFRVAFI